MLVIEDDGVIARAMGAHLRTSGFDFEWADDGTKGLRKLRFERPDVCVVDLMLPGLDGWGLIERARDEGLMTPILAVSARGNEHDKVATLTLGADDYLAKPFGMAEFMARVQALARRARIAPPSERDRRSSSPACASIPPSTAPSCWAPRAPRSMRASRARSSGCCTSWRATPAACSAATSCTSASGTCPTGTATAPSTCSCASCARSSTLPDPTSGIIVVNSLMLMSHERSCNRAIAEPPLPWLCVSRRSFRATKKLSSSSSHRITIT